MTLPEGVPPSGPTESASSEPAVEPEVAVTEEPAVTEPATAEDDTTAEDASDAELRAWARDNGIEGVPGSGKLSASWREQITTAMAAAMDPKEEGSADSTPTESSLLEMTVENNLEDGHVDPVVAEYRSVFEAPNTFVTSQAFTA